MARTPAQQKAFEELTWINRQVAEAYREEMKAAKEEERQLNRQVVEAYRSDIKAAKEEERQINRRVAESYRKDQKAAKDEEKRESQSGLANAFAAVIQRAGVGEVVGRRVGGLFGGMGGRLGGAIGAAAGAVGEASSRVQEGTATPFQAVLSAAIPVVGAFKSVIGEIVSIGPKLLEAFMGMVQGIAGFVKFSDPGRVERLNMAMEDLQAAVGAGLAPLVDALVLVFDQLNQVVTGVMQIMRPAFQQLGDMFQHLVSYVLGVYQPLLEMLADFFAETVSQLKPIFDEFMQSFDAVGRVLRESFEAMRPLATQAFRQALEVATTGLRMLAEAVRWVLTQIFGIKVGGGRLAPRGARSVAARPAQFIGTEEIGQQARLAAFGSRGTLQDAMEQNVIKLDMNFNAMDLLRNVLINLPQRIADALADLGETVGKAIARWLGLDQNQVGNAGRQAGNLAGRAAVPIGGIGDVWQLLQRPWGGGQ